MSGYIDLCGPFGTTTTSIHEARAHTFFNRKKSSTSWEVGMGVGRSEVKAGGSLTDIQTFLSQLFYLFIAFVCET
jgi:hypothetical protein